MTTVTEVVTRCPSCARRYRHLLETSSNNFGAQQWSDGWTKSPYGHKLMGIYQCTFCHRVFEISECQISDPSDPLEALHNGEGHPTSNEDANSRRLSRLTNRVLPSVGLRDCEMLLKNGNWSDGRDFELRLCLGWWWHIGTRNRLDAISANEALNNPPTENYCITDTELEAIKRLEPLLLKRTDQMMVVGELRRRQGRFDDAIVAYRSMSPILSVWADQLIALAMIKVAKTVLLSR